MPQWLHFENIRHRDYRDIAKYLETEFNFMPNGVQVAIACVWTEADTPEVQRRQYSSNDSAHLAVWCDAKLTRDEALMCFEEAVEAAKEQKEREERGKTTPPA